jgi:hypothetical protein
VTVTPGLADGSEGRKIVGVTVQLLFFPGCPLVDLARCQLARALSTLASPPEVTELDVTSDSTPPHLRSWGSPTILVDGVDVAGGVPSGNSCRLYPGSPDSGAPPLPLIEAALARGRSGVR